MFPNNIYIYKVRGRIVAILLVLFSIIAVPVINSYGNQLGQIMVDGLINYVCYPMIGIGIMISGYYHNQYIHNENELIEQYGYLVWGTKNSVLVSEIYEVKMICVWRKRQSTKTLVDRLIEIILKNGTVHKEFSNADAPRLMCELNRLKSDIVFSNHAITQQGDAPESATPPR